jgi:RNA polymerase sigma-70 factor (ECF subfamily)
MDEHEWLAERFEAHRGHLRGVAYRMLGSLSEADDAVQEVWLRLSRTDTSSVENLGGWLTTVAARVCLDMLRARKSRREESLEEQLDESSGKRARGIVGRGQGGDPEQEALMADSVGLALLVVLETLTPAERLAFVLHDLFDLPFDEIAPIVERSPMAARQLASRARRRVRGTATISDATLTRQRKVVDAFLTAARGGDFQALLAILDPDVIARSDAAAAPTGVPRVVRGAEKVARSAVAGGARGLQAALVNGAVGVVVAPHGQLLMVLNFTIIDGKIIEIEAVADPERLRHIDLAIFSD